MGKVTGRTAIGAVTPGMLVIGTKHPTDVCHVTIAEGQEPLEKGTVLAVNENGECCILGTEGCKASYILAEDAEAAGEGGMVAAAYRCGDFNKGALKVKAGYEMTDEDIMNLRYGGIYLGNVM